MTQAVPNAPVVLLDNHIIEDLKSFFPFRHIQEQFCSRSMFANHYATRSLLTSSNNPITLSRHLQSSGENAILNLANQLIGLLS